MAEQIILEKFNAWTKGLDDRQARLAVFVHIRDIPYYLVPQIEDPFLWAASILKEYRGSCSPKHYLLGLLFEKLSIPIKYVTYPFEWGKQNIKYPEDLKKLAQGLPAGNHLACKAYIRNRWVLVDATWDIALKKAGFPVNENWDGESDTLNAVAPFDEIIHASLAERLKYVKEKKSRLSEIEKATYAQFIEKFNAWRSLIHCIT